MQGDDGSALSASLSQVRGWRREQQLPEGAGNGIPWAVLPSLVRNQRSSGQRRAFAALRTANSPPPHYNDLKVSGKYGFVDPYLYVSHENLGMGEE